MVMLMKMVGQSRCFTKGTELGKVCSSLHRSMNYQLMMVQQQQQQGWQGQQQGW
jgi:hypothetical protein